MKKIPEFFTILGLIILSTSYPQGGYGSNPLHYTLYDKYKIHIPPTIYPHAVDNLGPYYEESIFSQNFTKLNRIK